MRTLNKFLSLLAIILGTVGACVAVAKTDPSEPNWVKAFQVDLPLASASLLFLVVGIFIRHKATQRERRILLSGGGSLNDAFKALDLIQKEVSDLLQKAPHIPLDLLREEIERIVSGPIATFLENRDALLCAYGMGVFGRILSMFSPGERALLRAWSAATDLYPDEAVLYLQKASEAFQSTVTELHKLRQPQDGLTE